MPMVMVMGMAAAPACVGAAGASRLGEGARGALRGDALRPCM